MTTIDQTLYQTVLTQLNEAGIIITVNAIQDIKTRVE